MLRSPAVGRARRGCCASGKGLMISVSQVIVGEEEERGVVEVLRSGMLAQGRR